MTAAFTLPSNNGWSDVSFTLVSRITVKGETALVFRIEAEGTYWDRADWEDDDGAQGADRVPDFSIALHQALVTEASLRRLPAALESWLDNRETELDFAFDCPDDQDTWLSIGKLPGFVLGLEKAVFSLYYATSRLAPIDIRFVVDETCVRVMKDGLDEMCRSLDAG